MSFRADIVTLFPDLFPGPLGASVIGRGLSQGLWDLSTTQLRDFASDKHRTVDDTPAGGGPGMVLKPDILAAAVDAVSPPRRSASAPADEPRAGDHSPRTASANWQKGPAPSSSADASRGVDQRVIESA